MLSPTINESKVYLEFKLDFKGVLSGTPILSIGILMFLFTSSSKTNSKSKLVFVISLNTSDIVCYQVSCKLFFCSGESTSILATLLSSDTSFVFLNQVSYDNEDIFGLICSRKLSHRLSMFIITSFPPSTN